MRINIGLAWMAAVMASLQPTAPLIAKTLKMSGETVVIAITDRAGIASLEVQEMRSRLDQLLCHSGIRTELNWNDHSVDRNAGSPNPLVSSAPRILVEILPDKTPGFGISHISLGLTLVGTNRAILHASEIQRVANMLGLGMGSLMACVFVHELGHILLGPEHSGAGILRADWTREVRMVLAGRGIPFSPEQTRRMRAELRRRRMSLESAREGETGSESTTPVREAQVR